MLTSALKTIVNKQVEEKKKIYIYIYISFLWEIKKSCQNIICFFFSFPIKTFLKWFTNKCISSNIEKINISIFKLI